MSMASPQTSHSDSPANGAAVSPGDLRQGSQRAQSFSTRFAEVLDKNRTLEAELERVRKQRDEVLEKLNRSRKRVEKSSGELEALRSRNTELVAKVGSLEDDIALLRPAKSALETENAMLRNQIEEGSDASAAVLRQHLLEMTEELNQSLRSERMLQDLLEDANLRLEELDSLRASWREALSGETSSLDALASVQHDLALRLDECASLRERALVLEKQNVKLEQMLDDEREANAEMERRLHESSQECATLKGVVAEKQKHYVELKKEADTMRTELEKLRKTCEEQQKRLVRLDELEEEYPILQADKAEAESRLAALQKQVTGGAEVSEDVLDRIARMQLLHATLDEELSDMMLSYGALSPKKQREVIAMQQRYRVATLPTDDFERVTAANQSRTYAAAPGASGAAQDDDMGSIIDNGSELDDMLSDTFSVPATPRDHAAMDNNNKSGAAQNKGHHSRQGSTVVVENARVRDDSDDEDY